MFLTTGGRKSKLGRKIAKMWNKDAHFGGFRCECCGATCGQEVELINHYRKKHKNYLEELSKKKDAA